MKDMILILACAAAAGTVLLLWLKDRANWKQICEKQKEKEREYLQRKEEQDGYIRKLENDLAQSDLENQALQAEIRALSEQQKERDRGCSDRQEDGRKAMMKIHIYAQLLREQIQTAAGQSQCDIILRECEKLMEPGEKALLKD